MMFDFCDLAQGHFTPICAFGMVPHWGGGMCFSENYFKKKKKKLPFFKKQKLPPSGNFGPLGEPYPTPIWGQNAIEPNQPQQETSGGL
jgi:hypothetical protein